MLKTKIITDKKNMGNVIQSCKSLSFKSLVLN